MRSRDAATTASAARESAERIARRLAEDPRVQLVYLFGSAANEDAPEVRDIDLGLLARPEIGSAELLDIRSRLPAAPVEVDLVSLNRASIVLCHQVAEHGRLLFGRGPDAEVEFVTRARSRYWDFSYYLEEQWRLAGERLEARRRGSEA